MNRDSGILYQINDSDEIVFVSDAWNDFANSNNSVHLVSPNILGKSLWSFITDAATEQLYREIVNRVRGGQVIDFQFRCDSPAHCRFLKMIIMSSEDGSVTFETQTLREWNRLPQTLLQSDIQRTGEIIRICGWCKKVDVGVNLWEEIEQAVMTLGLFEKADALPVLTHGICDACYQSVTKKLKGKIIKEPQLS